MTISSSVILICKEGKVVHTDVCPTPSELPDEQMIELPLANNDYEKLYVSLYTYTIGAISFLELLTAFERILNVTSTPGSDEAEMVDG